MIPYSMTTILRQKKRKHCNFEKSDFSAAFHLLRSTRTKTLIHRCVIEVGKMASESPEDSMWMDNLEEWVGDQNEVVTVKSLSRGLKVRVFKRHPSAETVRYIYITYAFLHDSNVHFFLVNTHYHL